MLQMQHDVGAPHDPHEKPHAGDPVYWRGVVRWTLLGLFAWLFVTVAVSWFAGSFNRWTVAGAPAGFWLAAQGAIVAYLIIIVAHGWVMDRLEARRQASEPTGSPVSPT